MDTDTKIIKIIEKNGVIRRRELIKRLMEDPLDDNRYSVPTINRKIRKLKNIGKILEIESDQYANYGINDLDKNATYFVLSTANDYRKFIDEILPNLKSNNEAAILATLNEIERYRGKYRLNPFQLDSVVLALDYDRPIVEKSLWILFYHLYAENGKIIKPSDTVLLIKKLNEVLSRFGLGDDYNPNIHQHCLDILGLLKDPNVVDQLIKDAKSLKQLKAVKGHYEGRFTGESIEAQRKVLFDLEVKLRKTKSDENTQIADIIVEIRSMASETVLNRSNETEGKS